MFSLLLATENPFAQLMGMMHSPLFWLMAIGFVALSTYIFLKFVRNDNNMSEEERYLSAILHQRGYQMVNAEIQKQAGPFVNIPADVTESMGSTRSTYWLATAQNQQSRTIELWAKILYSQHQIITVKWIPDIQNPTLQL